MNVVSFYLCLFSTFFLIFWLLSDYLFRRVKNMMRIKELMKNSFKETVKRKRKKNRRTDLQRNKLVQMIERHLSYTTIPLTANEFLLIQLVISFLVAAIISLLSNIIVSMMLWLAANAAVFVYMVWVERQRKEKMVQQLPQVLELVSNSLKAGYSIIQAFDLVSKENFSPLSEEFTTMIQSVRLGETLEKALLDFSERLNIPEMSTVTDTILIARETGGNFTHVIDRLLDVMRENSNIKKEIKTLSAQGRLSAFIVGGLPFALLLVLSILNPSYTSMLYKSAIGLFMLGFGMFLQVIGIIVMSKIIRLDVR